MLSRSLSFAKLWSWQYQLSPWALPLRAAVGLRPQMQSRRLSGDPEGRIAASPLSILSIAGGNVFVKKSGSSEWTAGKVGMALDPGDSVKTDATGTATVTFFEGSTVELSGTTEVSLTELDVAERTATSIRLKQEVGRTMSRVKKLVDPASRYEIETRAAIAAVRGSTMLVEVAPDGTTTVGNVEGAISVFAQGVEIKIPPGQQSVTQPGTPPGQPEALTIAPTPVGPATTSATDISPLVTTPPASVPRIAVEKTGRPADGIPGGHRRLHVQRQQRGQCAFVKRFGPG